MVSRELRVVLVEQPGYMLGGDVLLEELHININFNIYNTTQGPNTFH